MSAWLVTQEHVDVLTTAAIALKLIRPDQADAIGDDFWQVNGESLRYRYEDADDPETGWDIPEPGSYHFTPRPVEDLFYVYMQAACYAYQACEHPEWKRCESALLVERMEAKIQAMLRLTESEIMNHPQAEKATWGAQCDERGILLLTRDEWMSWLRTQRVS